MRERERKRERKRSRGAENCGEELVGRTDFTERRREKNKKITKGKIECRWRSEIFINVFFSTTKGGAVESHGTGVSVGGGAVESHGTGVSVEEVLLSPMAQVSVWRRCC